MGIRVEPIAVWVNELSDQPQVYRVEELWRNQGWGSVTERMSFSEFWNRTCRYPRCRYYVNRFAWRFYFNNHTDRTAWLLGADLHDT